MISLDYVNTQEDWRDGSVLLYHHNNHGNNINLHNNHPAFNTVANDKPPHLILKRVNKGYKI
jgi:hypothetical protein